MKEQITISFPYNSKEEFENRQKQLFKETFSEILPDKPVKQEIETYGTRKQVAKKLHISLPTLNELTKSGVLIGFKIGGRVLYEWEQVNNAVKQIESTKFKRAQ